MHVIFKQTRRFELNSNDLFAFKETFDLLLSETPLLLLFWRAECLANTFERSRRGVSSGRRRWTSRTFSRGKFGRRRHFAKDKFRKRVIAKSEKGRPVDLELLEVHRKVASDGGCLVSCRGCDCGKT